MPKSQSQPPNPREIDGVVCRNCGRCVTPRVSFQNGRPYKSWCPFCGAEIEDFVSLGAFAAFIVLLVGLAVVLYIL